MRNENCQIPCEFKKKRKIKIKFNTEVFFYCNMQLSVLFYICENNFLIKHIAKC